MFWRLYFEAQFKLTATKRWYSSLHRDFRSRILSAKRLLAISSLKSTSGVKSSTQVHPWLPAQWATTLAWQFPGIYYPGFQSTLAGLLFHLNMLQLMFYLLSNYIKLKITLSIIHVQKLRLRSISWSLICQFRRKLKILSSNKWCYTTSW